MRRAQFTGHRPAHVGHHRWTGTAKTGREALRESNVSCRKFMPPDRPDTNRTLLVKSKPSTTFGSCHGVCTLPARHCVLSPPAHTTPIPIAATSAAHMMTRRPARRQVRKAVRRGERGWGCVPFTRAAYPTPWYPAPRGTHSQAILGLDTDNHRGPAGRGVGGEHEGRSGSRRESKHFAPLHAWDIRPCSIRAVRSHQRERLPWGDR